MTIENPNHISKVKQNPVEAANREDGSINAWFEEKQSKKFRDMKDEEPQI